MMPDQLFKRYLIFATGIFIMALGIALSTRADIGISPISCVPYILSLEFPLTMGTFTILLHISFIAVQIVLLRNEFELVQLLQIPVAFVFGAFTDLALWLAGGLTPTSYLMRWIFLLVSCALIAFGVCMEVAPRVVMVAGEGAITAIVKVFKTEFGLTKLGFDVTLVTIGIIVSIALFSDLEGVREGTIAAAILVGFIARHIKKYVDTGVARVLHEGS